MQMTEKTHEKIYNRLNSLQISPKNSKSLHNASYQTLNKPLVLGRLQRFDKLIWWRMGKIQNLTKFKNSLHFQKKLSPGGDHGINRQLAEAS